MTSPRGARRRISAAEAMRRKVAREVHDDFGQRLAAFAFSLKAVSRGLPEDVPQRAELQDIGGGLSELGEDLRRLSHDLHPAALEHRGLTAALRDHCGEVGRRHDLRVELSLDGAGDALPPEVALGLYRIVQEALANTIRHAQARTATISLRVASGRAFLTATDDGRGFDPGAARDAGGFGLTSLEERAQALGGGCRITSIPGEGTRIEVAVPLPAEGPFAPLRELARRHRSLVISTALVILALSAGLVATFVQAWRAHREAARADAAALFLESLFNASDPRQARGRPLDARELLGRGSQRLRHELRGQPLLRARLLDTLGGIDTELGLYDDARPLLAEALALRERLLGRRDPQVADTLVRLGSLARLSGRGDALPLFQRALAIREDRLGPADPAVADVLGKLGTALAARGRFDEAGTTLRRALVLTERLWGKNDPRVAKVLHNLSGIAYYREDLAEYERLLQRALAIREAVLPADDLDLAGSREAMALLRLKEGRPAEAAQLLERLAATCERVYGPQHPQLAKTLLNLGLARADLGQDAAARQLFERAVTITDRSLAPDHPQHVRALATLARFDFDHGRQAEARSLYRRLLALHAQGAPYDDWKQVLANAARLPR